MVDDVGGTLPDALDDLSARIQARLRTAEQMGYGESVTRLRAMQAVVATRVLPLACPDTFTVAAEVALAACEGHSEADWYAQAVADRPETASERAGLDTAVRLLKAAGLWPWDVRRAQPA